MCVLDMTLVLGNVDYSFITITPMMVPCMVQIEQFNHLTVCNTEWVHRGNLKSETEYLIIATDIKVNC